MWIALLISPFSGIGAEQKTAFQQKSRIVEDIFNRNLALRRVKIRGVTKVSITLQQELDQLLVTPPLKGYSSVVNIRRSYDFNHFGSLTDNERNKAILEIITSSLIEAASKFGWEKRDILEISDEVKRVDYKQCYIEGRLKTSPKKKHKAGVEVDMQREEAIICVVYFSIDGELLNRVELARVRPARIFIAPLIGKSKWSGNEEFHVANKDKTLLFKTSINKTTAELCLTPNGRNTDDIIDDLLIALATTDQGLAQQLLLDRIKEIGKRSGSDQ